MKFASHCGCVAVFMGMVGWHLVALAALVQAGGRTALLGLAAGAATVLGAAVVFAAEGAQARRHRTWDQKMKALLRERSEAGEWPRG